MTPEKRVDMALIFASCKKRIVVIDCPRTSESTTKDYDPLLSVYAFIESLKNGFMVSPKYQSVSFSFPTVYVLVFANFEPDKTRLSKDRWNIKEIKVEEEQKIYIPDVGSKTKKIKRKSQVFSGKNLKKFKHTIDVDKLLKGEPIEVCMEDKTVVIEEMEKPSMLKDFDKADRKAKTHKYAKKEKIAADTLVEIGDRYSPMPEWAKKDYTKEQWNSLHYHDDY